MDFLERLEEKELKEDRRFLLSENGLRRIGAKELTAIISAIFLVGGLLYIALGRNIYFWDDATYWEIGRSLINGEIEGPFWKTVYSSIGTLDYNYVAALPSVLWMLIFGQSRISYVAGLVVMYVVPTVILAYRLAAKLTRRPRLALAVAMFIMPALMFEVFSGFADVGGVLMILACYNLYYTDDGVTGRISRYAAIGALLVLMMIFRRYFAFFAVSFVTVAIIDCIIFGRKVGNIVAMLAVTVGLLCTVFYPFLTGILLKDYAKMYSGYKYAIGTDMRLITRYLGLLFIALAAVVPVVSVVKRREFRPVMLWAQMIVCAVMFMVTQTHGQQHLLLYIPGLMILTMFMVNYIPKKFGVQALCVVIALNIGSTFIKREQPQNIRDIKGYAAIPTFSLLPVVRDDVDSIAAIRQGLDSTVPEGKKVGVISSSFVLNDSILRNVYASLGEPEERSGSYIVSMPEVDSRDMWRIDELYTSDYVLVGNPAQTHLADGEQMLVTVTVESFANNTDIAQIYKEIDGFVYYADGVEFKLYERTIDIDSIRKREFESKLDT